jgi:hypothetical protein
MFQLKLILLFHSIANDDIKLRELLQRFGLERFTPLALGDSRGSACRSPRGVAHTLRTAPLLPKRDRGVIPS